MYHNISKVLIVARYLPHSFTNNTIGLPNFSRSECRSTRCGIRSFPRRSSITWFLSSTSKLLTPPTPPTLSNTSTSIQSTCIATTLSRSRMGYRFSKHEHIWSSGAISTRITSVKSIANWRMASGVCAEPEQLGIACARKPTCYGNESPFDDESWIQSNAQSSYATKSTYIHRTDINGAHGSL